MKKSTKKDVGSKVKWEGVASIGMDLSDRSAEFHALDGKANTIGTGKVTLAHARRFSGGRRRFRRR